MKTRKLSLKLCASLLVVVVGLVAAFPHRLAAAPQTDDRPNRVVGYFIQWGIYGRNFVAKNLKDNGSAAKVTHINYAFAGISPDLKCMSVDPWADYQKPFDASQSVDGQAETYSDFALHGNFNQLLELKRLYHFKLLISIGGFTLSDGFYAAAQPANRAAFVSSCIDMFIKGNFSPTLSQPGVFDGIDIDWEYPGTCGFNPSCGASAADTANFTGLMQEFRTQLDALGATTHKNYVLTFASPAGEANFSKIELNKVRRYVNFINLLTYDYHGPWESKTDFNAPLFADPSDPDPNAAKFNIDYTVKAHLKAGISPHNLVLGVPFYGHGWRGVPDINHGLYQPATGAAPATFEAGSEDYKTLKTLEGSYQKYRNSKTKEAWIYNPSTQIFWGYDDPSTIKAKMKYIRENDLGGAMFWEFSGDDANASLLTAIAKGLR